MRGKLNKRYSFFLIASLFLFTGFTPVSKVVSTLGIRKVNNSVKPVFNSSFIQHWYCEDFSEGRWKQELIMLKRLGINEIILQAVAFTDSKYAVYPTKISGFSYNDVDMLSNVLTVADSLSMKVRIGLAFNNEWWTKRASDKEWLDTEATVNKAIIREIVELYGNHPSLSSWYIPHEFTQTTVLTNKQQSNLNGFFKQIASETKLRSPGKDIMVSPFYNSKHSWAVPLPVWSAMVENILSGTGIDILALQDAVGANYNTIDQLENIFVHTKRATDAAGVKLYSVTETFVSTATTNVTASQNSVSAQISAVKSYVQGFVAFSINHYQNAEKTSQSVFYDEYYNYYLLNK